MAKMKLNKWQYAWIKKLKSGKTRKTREKLESTEGGSYCCLGIGAMICEESNPHWRNDDNLFYCCDTLERLALRDEDGKIEWNLVSEKWKKILLEKGLMRTNSVLSLAGLNDGIWPAKGINGLTHKEIGQFIDENREAVFDH